MSKVLVVLLWAGVGWGQPAPAASLNDALAEMAGHAGVIFAGQVEEVARHDEAGYVDIRFQVEEPIRGCSRLTSYVVREWAGRWAGREDRYAVGQRLLMLLTSPSEPGFSAPVYGVDGAIPLQRGMAGPVAGPAGVPVDTGVQTDMVADLRLLDARVTHISSTQSANMDVLAPIQIVPDDTLTAAPPLAAVLSLLRGATADAH